MLQNGNPAGLLPDLDVFAIEILSGLLNCLRIVRCNDLDAARNMTFFEKVSTIPWSPPFNKDFCCRVRLPGRCAAA